MTLWRHPLMTTNQMRAVPLRSHHSLHLRHRNHSRRLVSTWCRHPSKSRRSEAHRRCILLYSHTFVAKTLWSLEHELVMLSPALPRLLAHLLQWKVSQRHVESSRPEQSNSWLRLGSIFRWYAM